MAGKGFIEADLSGMGEAMGVIEGMTTTMKTPHYIDDVVYMAHGIMANEFDWYMDALYAASPRMFHHVYEWNSLGGKEPGRGRLWAHTFSGFGANKNASWAWLPSHKPVPTPQQRANNPDDPMSQLDEDELDMFSNRRYYFPQKAAVMESGLAVSISPKNGKRIVFPVWDAENPLRFSKGLRVEDPGGQETTGAFTTAWTGWWAMEGPQVFDDVVVEIVERDLDDTANRTLRRAQRSRTKTFSMNAKVNYDTGFASGMRAAQQDMTKKSARYRKRNSR